MTSLVELLTGIARQTGCENLPACRKALETAAGQQRSLVSALLDEGLVDETRFLTVLSGEMGFPWWNETLSAIPAPLKEKVPARLALKHHLLPVRQDPTGLLLLTFDPFDLLARQAAVQAIPDKIQWSLSTRRQIRQGLQQGYGVGAETFEQLLEGRDLEAALEGFRQETTVVDREDSEASVIKFVNQIIKQALDEKATDIHFEPIEDNLQIRFRLDGVLHEVPVPGQMKLLQDSVISRLKIMAHLDIAERRLPQDGRMNLEFEGQAIDVRVVTIPSVSGESICLRLLGQQKFDLARLALDPASEEKISRLLAMPNGIVLLTGPTGCGKSTTLYTFLSKLNSKERKIVTVEDPVENKLPGVTQIAVKPEINLTFAAALRTILRGDPNVVMVGEMRDFETAEIAIRAALTGHLVFSTLHTNDAIGAITRLIDLGVEPFLVGSAVRAFMAQRLVRLLCPDCKVLAKYPMEELKEIGFPLEHAGRIHKTKGCDKCRQTGYRGRMALFEICLNSPKMQELIMQKKTANTLRMEAIGEGMAPLRQYGWNKVIAGLTTIEEVVRVTTADLEALDE